MTQEDGNVEYMFVRPLAYNKATFVATDDIESLLAFRKKHGNQDLTVSSWRYSWPDPAAFSTRSLYFYISSYQLEEARISTIEALYYFSENFGIPEDCIEVIYNGGGQVGTINASNRNDGCDTDGDAENAGYLDGTAGVAGRDGYLNGMAITDNNTTNSGPATEMIILIKPAVFGRQPSPVVPALNYRLARRLCEDGIGNINIDVYEKNHFLPLLNSKSSATDRYFIHLSPKELSFLDATGLRNLAENPRAEDSLIITRRSDEAAEWFAEELKETEQKQQQQEKLRALILKVGWQITACIWRLQRLCLYDNKRLETYRAVSQFYAFIGAGEQEIRRQITEMDQRNPIHDYQKLNAIVSFAVENSQFIGCGHPLLKQFCPAGKCFMAELIAELEQPHLFGGV